ncbi:hypothetical protein COV18_02165 [Candidatus Woesearchaeota archaeon CG10_big_fil_rev_8_21_14_0_10_37_12]|nr:MAG: hypothetical protein COV18_02165 [Candidatus Woesearchaeota archaeon CG10_big_fil_rev_8_21_14_0_10_37_12]
MQGKYLTTTAIALAAPLTGCVIGEEVTREGVPEAIAPVNATTNAPEQQRNTLATNTDYRARLLAVGNRLDEIASDKIANGQPRIYTSPRQSEDELKQLLDTKKELEAIQEGFENQKNNDDALGALRTAYATRLEGYLSTLASDKEQIKGHLIVELNPDQAGRDMVYGTRAGNRLTLEGSLADHVGSFGGTEGVVYDRDQALEKLARAEFGYAAQPGEALGPARLQEIASHAMEVTPDNWEKVADYIPAIGIRAGNEVMTKSKLKKLIDHQRVQSIGIVYTHNVPEAVQQNDQQLQGQQDQNGDQGAGNNASGNQGNNGGTPEDPAADAALDNIE